MNVEALLREHRIVPVITLAKVEDAVPTLEALIAGGLPVAEITLRTPAAWDGLRAAADLPGLIVGAGSVMNAEQCQKAVAAGARFIVSPGLDEGVVESCRQAEVPCFPGISTAGELQRAFNLGLQVVKFFPAEALGGLRLLRALAAPFPDMRFMPTGGISPENVMTYLQFPATFAVGGSWMVNGQWIADRHFSSITAATKQALELVRNQRPNEESLG